MTSTARDGTVPATVIRPGHCPEPPTTAQTRTTIQTFLTSPPGLVIVLVTFPSFIIFYSFMSANFTTFKEPQIAKVYFNLRTRGT